MSFYLTITSTYLKILFGIWYLKTITPKEKIDLDIKTYFIIMNVYCLDEFTIIRVHYNIFKKTILVHLL